MSKKSFVLYYDQKEVVDELDDEQAGKLFKAIYEYNVNKKIDLAGVLKLVFIPFKNCFDRDEEKYEEIVEKRSDAGKKGMQKRWNQRKNSENTITNDNKNNKSYQMITNDNKRYQTITNITDSVSVSVNDNDNVSDNVNDSVCVINNTPDNTHTQPSDFSFVSDFGSTHFADYDSKQVQKSCKKFYTYYKEKDWQGVNNWQQKLEMWIENDIDQGKILLCQRDIDDNYVDEAGFSYKNGRRML